MAYLLQIGVWERGEDLAARVAALSQGRALVRGASHPAQLAGPVFDLLVVSPQASGWAGAGAVRCGTALVPGGLAALTRWLPAPRMLSYGMGTANTLTLSSMGEGRASVAVQREFDALSGGRVERQELVLPYDGQSPDLFRAIAGVSLLIGGPMEADD